MPGNLVDRAAAALGRRHPRFLAVEVSDGVAGTAVRGFDPGADVEIGSVSKGLTGLLFADARSRGVVSDETPLGGLLDVGDAIGAVPLGSLATHCSGLPRLARGVGLRGQWGLMVHGRNPYGEDLAGLLDSARRTPLRRPRPRYSNLGFMLLGHALAAAEGVSYRDLLRARVLEPLGMDGATIPSGPVELGPHAATGTSRRGRPVEAWTGEALGPAGGVRCTARDLERLVTALLDGSAPGIEALDPVATMRGERLQVGAGWMVLRLRERTVTWHNGGTGGFRSMVCVDRSAGTGVALVSATARSVDRAAFGLLEALGHASGR
ncbi:serine hydrolase [uncultured Phycicoccus sp.]|uniref:serine hydrolase domain-containing protein n=1 Tax=uncultured Phycicoccus sp. TaxID=661422 RepID=UPI002621F044|nr:serine hydrolase domain-containing protein [uncultured Phycicoccus sp.]